MKYYFKTKSSGRCGCSSTNWYVTEEYATKKELKSKALRNIVQILTDEQLTSHYGDSADVIRSRARKW